MDNIGGIFPPQTPEQTRKHPFQLPTSASLFGGSPISDTNSGEDLASPITLLNPSSSPVSPLLSITQHPERLIRPRKTKEQRDHEQHEQECRAVDKILHAISDCGLSAGTFFYLFLSGSKNDLRTPFHKKWASRFLQGQDKYNFVDVLKKAYNHRNAYPSRHSRHKSERTSSFSLSGDPSNIRYARIGISSFSAQLCAKRATRDVDILTKEEEVPVEGGARTRMPYSEVSWEDIESFSPARSVETFRRRAPFISNFIESIVENNLKDDLLEDKNQLRELAQDKQTEADNQSAALNTRQRKNRPTAMIILSSINPLIVARNKQATGYLSMPLGIHEFASQTHTDIKRFTCRLGLSVGDSTVRKALVTMTEHDLDKWRQMNIDAAAEGELGSVEIIDNTQRQIEAREAGLFRQNEMKTGTACTSVKIHNSPPGAWNLPDHLGRVAENKRADLTTSDLFMTIDWAHHLEVSALHAVLTLLNFIPSLSQLHKAALTHRFRSPPVALHRMPDNVQTEIQPLGTNAEKEVETQGLKRCILDFDQQSGLDAVDDEKVLQWVGGDGATFATFLRLQKYLAPTSLSNRDTLRNKIGTPEAWHAKHTALIAIAQNHFGPATSMDPSSLSKLYASINFKRPADPKKCDHYPTVDGMTLVWIGQILDCWRILLDVNDLEAHFDTLSEADQLPSLDALVLKGRILVQRYASIRAYEHALSSDLHKKSDPALKVPTGTPWTSPNVSDNESPVFDGDRSLANGILFKMQFGSWLALDFAIHDGDVGIVMEQLKVWTFMFAGSTHQQYSQFLLELHCLLEFESSPPLCTAILNNYLVKFGLRAKERDLMQEDHNKKLEAMVTKAGGNFDDPYYRKVISPNPELRVLLKDINDYELHYFRPMRDYGHTAIELVGAGYRACETDRKLDSYLTKSSARSKFIIAIENEKLKGKVGSIDSTTNNDKTMMDTDHQFNTSTYNSSGEESESSDTSVESEVEVESEDESDGELDRVGDNRNDMFGGFDESSDGDMNDEEEDLNHHGTNTNDNESYWSGSDS
ncbi:hypothetical protein AAF712_011564 [Marasmius tenuissimus]|uniref:DUF6589 domain-containing protein n=1 Tax=Marasmius tenuissimus TaxID=585030 RepID=A0ABR2ZK29_9AGAR